MSSITHVNAVQMLKEDHRKVQGLFKQFEAAGDDMSRHEFAAQAMRELTVHATLEEEMFYPAMRQNVDSEEIVDHAEEEHADAKNLISELEGMAPGADFNAKFKVLSESVLHHVEEEEGKMLPQAENSGMNLQRLGEEMAERRRELTEQRPEPSGGEPARTHGRTGGRGKNRRRH